MVFRRVQIGILACCLLSRELLGGWRHFFGVCRSSFLFSSLLGFHTVRTVKRGATVVHLFAHHVAIDVGVVNDGLIHVRNSGVVTESVSFPSAAPVTIAPVAMAVVYASVITDSRSPIAVVEDVRAIVPAPPRRGPKQTHGWWSNPRARDPIIIALTPAPVTRSPNVALHRTRRLLYHRQNRWSDVDRYAYLGERDRQRQDQKCS